MTSVESILILVNFSIMIVTYLLILVVFIVYWFYFVGFNCLISTNSIVIDANYVINCYFPTVYLCSSTVFSIIWSVLIVYFFNLTSLPITKISTHLITLFICLYLLLFSTTCLSFITTLFFLIYYLLIHWLFHWLLPIIYSVYIIILCFSTIIYSLVLSLNHKTHLHFIILT